VVSEPIQPQPDAERRVQRTIYPLWQPTDWAPRQRRLALAGQLLLALACGWLTYTLVVWGRSGAPTVDSSRQLGMTLLCLGATLLTTAYWYAQCHACNVGSSEAGRLAAAAALLPLEGGVALLALAAQGVHVVVHVVVQPIVEHADAPHDGAAAEGDEQIMICVREERIFLRLQPFFFGEAQWRDPVRIVAVAAVGVVDESAQVATRRHGTHVGHAMS